MAKKIARGAGSVHVHSEDGTLVLNPGDEVPAGVEVGDHVLESGDGDDAEQPPVPGFGQTVLTPILGEERQKAADSQARKAAAKATADANKAAEKADQERVKAEQKATADAERAERQAAERASQGA